MNDMLNKSSGLPSCEIITIGAELLLGQIMDTNTTYLARELGRIGLSVRFRTSVGDRMEEIVQVIRSAIDRCEMVIMTGGLGPTMDDLTREAVARASGVDLEFRPYLLEHIEAIFRKNGYQMPENNRLQAFIPAGGQVIPNEVGTAPGFIKEINETPIICLPGVPREMKHLMTNEVTPWIRQRFGLVHNRVVYRVLKAVGISESKVDSMIGDLMAPGKEPEVGLLASQWEIKIRIAATGRTEKEAYSIIDPVAEEVRARFGNIIYGEDNDTLEGVIDSLLAKQDLTISILETFSAGIAAQRLHNLPAAGVIESRVIPDKIRLDWFPGEKEIKKTEEEFASLVARKTMEMGESALGLAIVGFPEENQGSYSVRGCAAVYGAGIEESFSWPMGGDPVAIQHRGAVIGLNTLRLALLSKVSRL